MYTIKQTPEDFRVTEIACWEVSNLVGGDYTYCLLTKRNIGTVEAVAQIASRLHIPVKNIGFAGNKDSKAITSQFISIKGSVTNFSFGDISITVVGKSDTPIHLGYLTGNSFEIIVRDVDSSTMARAQDRVADPFIIPNLFGEQRFSTNNAAVGKAIITGDFKLAVELVLKQGGNVQTLVEDHLVELGTDFIGALRCVPGKLLMLYVHAYQSLLFNELLNGSDVDVGVEIPLIGFGTELDEYSESIRKAVEDIMQKEGITFRDFIVRKLPEMSSEGSTRKAFIEVSDFVMKGSDPVAVSFTLPKNAYATVVVDYLFR